VVPGEPASFAVTLAAGFLETADLVAGCFAVTFVAFLAGVAALAAVFVADARAAEFPFACAILLAAVRLEGADFRGAAFLAAGAGDIGGFVSAFFRPDAAVAVLPVCAFFAVTFPLLVRFAGLLAAADVFAAYFVAAARSAAGEAGMAAFLNPRESQTCG
jgi:hypothetical protein